MNKMQLLQLQKQLHICLFPIVNVVFVSVCGYAMDEASCCDERYKTLS